MKSRDRREFLKLLGAAAPAFAFGTRASAFELKGFKTPGTVDRYIDPLPIPKRLVPVANHAKATQYRVRMMEFERQMHSQLPPTRLWGYEGQCPGPVIEAFRGKTVEVRWENRLPKQHLFKVDTKIHGAMAPAPAVRAVPHVHGARTYSGSDGLPEDWLVPGQSADYEYPNEQRAAGLWYHDHAMGITRLNVYAGLTGFYLLRDDEELALKLPAGEFEVPLLLQDRTLADDGRLMYVPTLEDGTKLPPGVWGPECFGELPVVNGAIFPRMDVEPGQYRFRVVNGANARFFHLYLNLAAHPTDVPNLVRFHQIGSDGGLLSKPVAMEKLLLGPGERADLIVDFTGLAGKTVTLSNSASVPFPGWDMMVALHAPLSELMQFRVGLPSTRKGQEYSFPAQPPVARLEAAKAVLSRDFVLTERVDDTGRSLGVRINDKGYDDPVTETPTLGTMERWRFINMTDDAHPMHLHLVQFQVLERQGFDYGAFLHGGELELVGTPRPPAEHEAGWKDTAVVTPKEVLTMLVPFDGYTGRYVFHCHMLEHEDNDMMRPFQVVAAK